MTVASCSLLLAEFHLRFDVRAEGWIHLALGDESDVLRGPVGVLGYLLFVPLFWLIPRRWSAGFLAATSLLWALLTLGPAYAGWLAAIVAGGWVALLLTDPGSRPPVVRPSRPLVTAVVLLSTVYGLLLIWPQPLPLPPVDFPLYFYIHWAGIGFVFLKVYHLLIDVSAGKSQRPSSGEYAAYLLFAPTLRMGPIYRADEFVSQLHNRPVRFVPACLGPAGLRLLTGLLRWGVLLQFRQWFDADAMFTRPETLTTWELVFGIYAQAVSIFLWISGYIDVAIGMGRLMGFRVPENFNYPWIATSLADFWRRWHITLGAWLRDFLYIPLGGNRRHVFLNYAATFVFCGVWHGLFPSYVAWGASQAIGLYVNRRWSLFWQDRRDRGTRLYRRLQRLGLVGSPVSSLLGWLLMVHYQVLTIALFTDEQYSFARIGPALVERLTRLLAP